MAEVLPRGGQIWREVDNRFDRFVAILEVWGNSRRSVLIQTVSKTDDGTWLPAPRARKSWCDPERFNGKHSGYELHQDIPSG